MNEQSGPGEEAVPCSAGIPGNHADELKARAAARSAVTAMDAEALSADPYLADAFARLDAAISDVADTRWMARNPVVLTAALRALAREQSRLNAAVLRLIANADDRD